MKMPVPKMREPFLRVCIAGRVSKLRYFRTKGGVEEVIENDREKLSFFFLFSPNLFGLLLILVGFPLSICFSFIPLLAPLFFIYFVFLF